MPLYSDLGGGRVSFRHEIESSMRGGRKWETVFSRSIIPKAAVGESEQGGRYTE
jgi:hypothetical protein